MGKNELSTERSFISSADFIRANELSTCRLPEMGVKIRQKENKVKALEKKAREAKTYTEELQIRVQKIALEKRIRKLEKLRIEFEKELIDLLMRLKPNIKKEE